MGNKFTRRRFLTAASAGAAWIALMNAPGCKQAEPSARAMPSRTTSLAQPEPVLVKGSPLSPQQNAWTFRTRPDLNPPAVDVARQAHDAPPSYIFAAPKSAGPGHNGPIIVDDHGQVVWFRHPQRKDALAMNFKVQHYRGEPVLTWWEGYYGSRGVDEYVILDSSYKEITRLQAGNGYPNGDHHEFLISPQDTALITIYNLVHADLSPVGGPKDGVLWQGIVQELDIETGRVVFEWHSLDHVGVDESYPNQEDPQGFFDYFHANSIDVDHDDNLLVSARRTSAVYKIDRKSGKIIWRLGGKKSDFKMGPGARFANQHDARRQKDGTITIFDNGHLVFVNGKANVLEESRAIVLELDEEKMSASLVHQYTHPRKLFADTGGSVQVLPNGAVFVGWGSEPVFSEFGKDGEPHFDATLPPGDASYRAFRFPWNGRPSEEPVAVAERASDEALRVYASWNGATQVATWEVLAGPSPNQVESLGSVPRNGFETAMLVRTAKPYVAVRAKNHFGQVLGTTAPVRL
jgi:Arylsulfotransferase (ASST)